MVNSKHRKEVAEFWGVEESFFPAKRGLFQTDIFPAIETGQIKRGMALQSVVLLADRSRSIGYPTASVSDPVSVRLTFALSRIVLIHL